MSPEALSITLMSRTIIYFHVYIILDFLIIMLQYFANQNAHVYIKQ